MDTNIENKKKYIEKLPDIPSSWSSIYEGLENTNGWINSFEDEMLYALINEALENNKDLGIAYENIKIARARAGASLAPLLPTISVGAVMIMKGQLDVGSLIGSNILAARALQGTNKYTKAKEFIQQRDRAVSEIIKFVK